MASPQLDWQIHKTNLSSRFKELYDQNLWTDCAFKVGDEHTEVLRGHKLVLAASSPVFEALFYGTLADKSDVIRVPDVPPDTFRLLLNYIYCDGVEWGGASIETAGHLLYAAKKYMLPHLVRACLDYLLDHTCVTTLWQVLAIAEDLDEDQLLSACLKVMCQYPGEMWVTNRERLGGLTLSRLLDQPSTNLLEVELWQLVVRWAEDQCEMRQLTPTPANKRALITQAGFLAKVRLLTLSPAEITEFVEPTGLLTVEEMKALRRSVSAIQNNKLITGNTSGLPESATLPLGFNSNKEARKRFMYISSRCSRICLTKRKKYTYGGVLKTKVSADSRILVTGFEVFTRIASTADYIMGHGSVSHYMEDLVMMLYDQEGNLLDRTEVSRAVAVFNVTQEVLLTEPVWFLPKHEYKVAFHLSSGQYPLSDLAPVSYNKSVRFRFSPCVQCEDSSGGLAPVDLDVSFINGIIFNV